MILAVEAAGLNLLVDNAGSNLQLRCRLEKHRQTSANAVAVVDVLFAVRPDGVDEAAKVRPIADGANCDSRRYRYIDRTPQRIAEIAALQHIHVALDYALHPVDVWL